MEIRSATVEKVLKSFAFSVALFVLWGGLTVWSGLSLRHGFGFTQLLWVVYNAAIALLFLVRSKPTAVSVDPLAWIVALVLGRNGRCQGR